MLIFNNTRFPPNSRCLQVWVLFFLLFDPCLILPKWHSHVPAERHSSPHPLHLAQLPLTMTAPSDPTSTSTSPAARPLVEVDHRNAQGAALHVGVLLPRVVPRGGCSNLGMEKITTTTSFGWKIPNHLAFFVGSNKTWKWFLYEMLWSFLVQLNVLKCWSFPTKCLKSWVMSFFQCFLRSFRWHFGNQPFLHSFWVSPRDASSGPMMLGSAIFTKPWDS